MGTWSDTAKATAIGAGVSAGSGLIGGIMSMIGSRRQYKNQKKLMALQNQYDIAAFEREKQAQKDLSEYMAVNSNPWLKTSLQNAGYSTADPNGSGVQTAGVSAPSMDVPGTPTAPYVDYSAPWQSVSQSAVQMAQVANLNAQTKKTESETDMQYILNDLKRVYGEAEVLSNLYNLDSQSFSNIANAMKADQDRLNSIQLTEAQVKDINQHLEMDWQKLEPEIQVLCEQIENLKRDGMIKEAEEKKIWQDIRESNARISRIMKENDLTDADIAVAKATENLKKQETRTEKNRTAESYQKAKSAKSEAVMNKIEADSRKALGSKYYKAKEVLDVVTQTAERVSNAAKNLRGD